MSLSKIWVLFAMIATLIILVGCNNQSINEETTTTPVTQTTIDPQILNDIYKPLLKIDSSEKNIIINQGEEYDLLKGVSGLDNLEGNITSKIEISIGDFDSNIPGEYEIFYFLSDTAGNSADPITRTITVLDTAIYQGPPIYTGVIPNEKPAPDSLKRFAGAWYHKVVSSDDVWYGIEGTITLPEVKLTRYENNSYNTSLDVDPNAKNLDNPSIYMGGNAQTESDVGLSFSRGCMGEDCSQISRGSFVFRPFWRYITNTDTDEGGYDVHNGDYAVSCTGGTTKNCIANWHFRDTKFYYLPGDKLRLIVYSPQPHYLQMQIEVIEKSTLPQSIKIREDNGWDDPENFKSPIFSSPGHGTGQFAHYKRVNAIDQVANEGLTEINTTSEVKTAIWHNVYLYRKIDEVMYRVPFTSERSVFIDNPDPARFTTYYGGLDPYGGEHVAIHPGRESTSEEK